MIAIRGATTISQNTNEEIKTASIELFQEILLQNNLEASNIMSIFFSCTRDITADYPGKYVREHYNLKTTTIMHYNEMYVENSLAMCIRILILVDDTIEDREKIKFVYLRDAKNLRKDLYADTF